MEVVEQEVKRIICEVIDKPFSVEESDFYLSDIGLNSISFIKMVVAVEKEFGIEFDDINLDYKFLDTFGSLVSYIKSKR